MSTQLVPYQKHEVQPYVFRLVDKDINFNNRDTVKSELPDILGRALARSWIDTDYKKMLERDVKHTLELGGVTLPDEYECDFEKKNGQRAKIVVYECTGKLRLRVCGLHLTMIASR